jgi:hypothetical protein
MLCTVQFAQYTVGGDLEFGAATTHAQRDRVDATLGGDLLDEDAAEAGLRDQFGVLVADDAEARGAAEEQVGVPVRAGGRAGGRVEHLRHLFPRFRVADQQRGAPPGPAHP